MSALPPDYKPTDAEKKALSKAQSLSSSRLDFLLVGGYAGFQVAKFAAARVVKNPALSRAVPVIMGVGGLSGAAGGLAVFREYQFRTLGGSERCLAEVCSAHESCFKQ